MHDKRARACVCMKTTWFDIAFRPKSVDLNNVSPYSLSISFIDFFVSNLPILETDLNSWTILKRLFISSRAAVIKLRVRFLQREKNISRKWSGHFSKISPRGTIRFRISFSHGVLSPLSPSRFLSLISYHPVRTRDTYVTVANYSVYASYNRKPVPTEHPVSTMSTW